MFKISKYYSLQSLRLHRSYKSCLFGLLGLIAQLCAIKTRRKNELIAKKLIKA